MDQAVFERPLALGDGCPNMTGNADKPALKVDKEISVKTFQRRSRGCVTCRLRKIKCSKEGPICSEFRCRDIDCRDTPSKGARKPKSEHFSTTQADLIGIREQIIENCQFITARHVDISIVVAKETEISSFRAFALQTRDGRREALLVGSGDTVQDAFQSLRMKSVEAVQRSIPAADFSVSLDEMGVASESNFKTTTRTATNLRTGWDRGSLPPSSSMREHPPRFGLSNARYFDHRFGRENSTDQDSYPRERENFNEASSGDETWAHTYTPSKTGDAHGIHESCSDVYKPDVPPHTLHGFAELFPSNKRLEIRHDDSTCDGNTNLRVDTAVAGKRSRAIQLFHLRVRDLASREFSLRRYCRNSGREMGTPRPKEVDLLVRKFKADSKPPTLKRSMSSSIKNLSGGQPISRRATSGFAAISVPWPSLGASLNTIQPTLDAHEQIVVEFPKSPGQLYHLPNVHKLDQNLFPMAQEPDPATSPGARGWRSPSPGLVEGIAAACIILPMISVLVQAQRDIVGPMLHIAASTSMAASAMIPPLRTTEGVASVCWIAAYATWGAAYCTFLFLEFYQCKDWLQRRLLVGMVVIAGLNFLGSLGQIEASTIEGVIVWGPLALTASLCVVPVLVQYMGAGATAAVMAGVVPEITIRTTELGRPATTGHDAADGASRQ